MLSPSFLLRIFVLTCFFSISGLLIYSPAYPQDETKESQPDISDKKLKKFYKGQDYYLNQLKKSYINEKQHGLFQIKLDTVESKIKLIRMQRLENAKNVPVIYEKEKFNFQFRDMDVDVSRLETPVIYAHEISTVLFNAGVSLLDLKTAPTDTPGYSAPLIFSVEKAFSQRISAGAFFGYFIEQFRSYKNYPADNNYFSANKFNYKYNDKMAGLRFSFHFLNPTAWLSYRRFDLYATAIAGINLPSKTKPFFDNGKYIGGYDNPVKNGPVYGAFAGLRYMYDDLLGFYAEAGYANTAFASVGLSLRLMNKELTGPTKDIISFKVKIMSSSRSIALNDPKFKGLSGINAYVDERGYIYTVGNESSLLGAEAVKESMVKMGFKKASIIAFKNDELISTKKANRILKKREKDDEEIKFPGER